MDPADDAESPATPLADLPTTLVLAIADAATLAALDTTVLGLADIKLVATTSDPAELQAVARTHVPDVLIVGADLVARSDAGGAADGPVDPPSDPDAESAPDDPAAPNDRGPTTDLAHPVAVGLRELCGAVNAELPAIRIVVTAPDGVHSYGAVLGGAIGCIRPAELPDRVVDATRRVARGEGLLTTEWSRAVLGDLGGRTSDRQEAGPLGRPVLTATELEVLRRTAAGATAADIAAHHGVPERDVNRGAASALMKARRLHDDFAMAEPPETRSQQA